MATGQNYSQAVAAIKEPSGTEHAARAAWNSHPETAANYIGINLNAGGAIYLYGPQSPKPYTPTEEDGNAVDWITGKGKPPRG